MGSKLSGFVIDKYFTTTDGNKDWHSIWFSFAAYALAIAILFLLLFRHRHDPNAIIAIHPEPILPAGE